MTNTDLPTITIDLEHVRGGQGMDPGAIGQQLGGLLDQFMPDKTQGKAGQMGGQIGSLVSSFMGMAGGGQTGGQ